MAGISFLKALGFASKSSPKVNGGIHSLSNAMEIVRKNPKTYSIVPTPNKGFINIVRDTNDWTRVASYNVKTGELTGMSRRPLGDNGIIRYDGKGRFEVQEYIPTNKKGHFYDLLEKSLSFDNLTDVIKFFRGDLPVVAKKY